ncbi:unnamed protein product [Eruca vesicaria subsp. sativa]|uniref:Uncharacterized protein n=1 Tax=Eruca vesicaria subsp. sativa TaxID=29727 RepID=A0ABC8LX11_ERUVS|nr:unnamed protein product [Eruca vesicaria subsp. sativa]
MVKRRGKPGFTSFKNSLDLNGNAYLGSVLGVLYDRQDEISPAAVLGGIDQIIWSRKGVNDKLKTHHVYANMSLRVTIRKKQLKCLKNGCSSFRTWSASGGVGASCIRKLMRELSLFNQLIQPSQQKNVHLFIRGVLRSLRRASSHFKIFQVKKAPQC